MNEKNRSSGPLALVATAWRHYSFIFVFAIILLVYVFTILANGNAFRWGHVAAILSSQNTVIVGLSALGMALVIITGQIDLSVGSALVLCTGVTIMVFNTTNSVLLTLLAGVLAGAFCGAFNGVLVGYAKMPPFIVTLGTMLIYRSLTLSFVRAIDPAITGSSSSQFSMISENSAYDLLRKGFGTGSLPGVSIPYITFVFVAVMLLVLFISRSTKYGKRVYAVGSNEKAAHLAGVNVQWIKVSVFLATGILVGLASFVQACKIGNVTPASSGKSYEMYAIAAVVLGGVNMAGGRGNILGVFFGALSYTTINFIIVSIPSLSTDIQDTFQGLVLILVILVQTVGPVIKERLRDWRNRHHAPKTAA
jgi:ribose transport system permease protein